MAYEPTRMSSKRDSDGNLSLEVEKYYPGMQTAYITFQNLNNATYTNRKPEIVLSSGTLLTIEPLNPNNPISYDTFYYRVYGGAVDYKADTTVIYRLPYKDGKEARALALHDVTNHLFEQQGQLKHLNYAAYGFVVERGDTIYATRRGVVVSKTTRTNTSTLAKEGNLSFSSKRPMVSIEHADGTTGTYSPFIAESIFVEEGDHVECGDPIGVVGTFDNRSFQMRFWLTRYVSNPLFKGDNNSKVPYALREYITPTFLTSEGETKIEARKSYTAKMESYLTIQEMTKREVNKWAKLNKVSKKQLSALLSKLNK